MAKETNLSGHSKDGKRLHPPFAKIKEMQLTSWKDIAMPEILWAVLVRGNLERNVALDFFRHVVSFAQHNPECADVRLTEIAKLAPNQRTALINHMAGWSPAVRQILQALLVFPNLPGRTEWAAILGEPNWETAGPDLATAVKEVLWHQSEPATDCRWVNFLCFLQSGKMKFASSIPGIDDIVRGIYEYPNYGDVAHVQAFVRSGDLRHTIGDRDLEWVTHFWDECYRKTECIPESAGQEFPYTQEEWDKRREHYGKETARIRKSLISHCFNSSTTSAIDVRFETIFGLALYSQTLLDEISILRLNFSVSGRLTLRAMVEAYITLAYLLKKDDPGTWGAYREYGSGQAKLVHLKLKELGKIPSSINPKTVDRIANEDKWQEFVSINIGHWDDSNLRKNAEESGLKDVYDQYYNWSSGYMHGNWAAVRETTYQSCYNPLHRLHRIPEFGLPMLPDVMEDAIEIGNKMLDLLDIAYPEYKDRIRSL